MAEGIETAKRIAVVAMDGSKHSDIALNFYVQNVYKENDEVIVMYCVHHKAQHKYESKWMPVDPNIIVHKYHEETAKGEEICKGIKEKLDAYQVGGKVMQLEGGDPGHTIMKKIEELGANLVVVGSRGHGTIRRKILGSVSEYILHHSPVPVFISRH
ncbi:unnamed protein product [Mytilus coruscus]|uniref:UspA domain-containing protein n=1 Tax=Mytilus coruscus TaxID=42192 RepID=A0A6J8F0S3_MYTCO|nr:unnamed protein product [Mytilus coruscus]